MVFPIEQSVSHPIAPESLNVGIFGNIVFDDPPWEEYGTPIPIITTVPEDEVECFILDDEQIVTPLGATSSEIIYQLEDTYEQISEVYVNNQLYTIGYSPLAPGTFRYDEELNQLVILPDLDTVPSVNLTVFFKAIKEVDDTLPTIVNGVVINSEVALRKVKKYNPAVCSISKESLSLIAKWNADAKISISHQFQGHSQLTFTFTACRHQEKEVLEEIGNGTLFTALNTRWRVHTININHQAFSKAIVVSVSCQDALASAGTPSISGLDRRVIKKTSGYYSFNEYRTVGEIAAISQVPYHGPSLRFSVGRNTSFEETVTLRELLNSRAIIAHGFVHYRGGVQVEVRKWQSTKTHVLARSQIRSPDLSFSYNGQGSYLDEVRLNTEYRNMRIQRNFHPDRGTGEETNNEGFTQRYTFTNCVSLGDMKSPREYNGFYYVNPKSDILNNPGINFDSGGPVKSSTLVQEINGSVTREITEKWGYAYASSETHSTTENSEEEATTRLSGFINPHSHWKRVEKTVTNYFYDSQGYLTGVVKRGRSIARLLQETENLEASNLKYKARKESDTVSRQNMLRQVEAYEFHHNLPIYDVTGYALTNHDNYFANTIQAGDRCNPAWVQPKFVSLMSRYSRSEIVKENPRNTEKRTFAPITVGKYLRESEKTTITKRTFPYKHEKRTRISNSEGARLKNATGSANVTQIKGKPGLHTRAAFIEDYRRGRPLVPIVLNEKRYILNSVGVSSHSVSGVSYSSTGTSRGIEGTKSYPDIEDIGSVHRIATTELSIMNTQNSLTTSMNIDRRENMEVGDFLIFMGAAWKILRIQDELSIENGVVRSTSFTINIGRYLTPELSTSSSDCRRPGTNSGRVPINADLSVEEVLNDTTPDHYYAFEGDLTDSA